MGDRIGYKIMYMDDLDQECNKLFRELDKLKADGKQNTEEYFKVLLLLLDKTRERLGG